jgi:hypothetical protein
VSSRKSLCPTHPFLEAGILVVEGMTTAPQMVRKLLWCHPRGLAQYLSASVPGKFSEWYFYGKNTTFKITRSRES